MLRAMEEATGFRQTTCPWRAMRDPFVMAVLQAHKDWKLGSLASSWPEVPYALRCGIHDYDNALNAVRVYDFRAEQKKRDAERPGPARWEPGRPPLRRRR